MEYRILRKLILLVLLGCCVAQVPRHGLYNKRKQSDGCALKLDRSFAPKITNPFLEYKDIYDPNELSMSDCIRYSDINQAFTEARKKFDYVHYERDYYDMELAAIGKLADILIETTRILAHRFQLNVKQINDDLPTIDTSKTDIWDMCPSVLRPSPCKMRRFRTVDGQCSTLKNSVLGATNTAFVRFLVPAYDDGINAARRASVVEGPLPNVRVVSLEVHRDYSRLSPRTTDLFMIFSQFLAHDLTFGAMLRGPDGNEMQCCPNKNSHPNCAPIPLPEKDPFFSRFNVTCLDFQRTIPALRPGCALGPRIPMNMLTTRLDANSLYGSTDKTMRDMRLFKKGLLQAWDKFRDLGLKELLPPQIEDPEKECIRTSRKLFCFKSGDGRVNVQPGDVALHTLYMRFHNAMAKQLAYLNPHWDDERLYQETRNILIATIQHVTYNEFLPLLIGPMYTRIFNLTLQKRDYWNGYNENTPMVTILPFQTAAFRFGHTLVHTRMRMFNKNNQFVDSIEFRDLIGQPFLIYRPGTMDKIISGLLNAPSQSFDRFMTKELTNHLSQAPPEQFGSDLASLNINRGRDHGLPGYNEYRELCGMPRIKTFKDLEHFMGNGTGERFAKIFKHPDDIDLWSASLAEPKVEGGTVGPTFACLIAHQFSILRKADPFWYENPGFPSSFTPAQLQEVRKVTLSKIICEHSDNILNIQMWPLLLPDKKYNPRLLCKGLPSINLEYWIEDPGHKKLTYSK